MNRRLEIIKEIQKTERTYIQTLKTLDELYIQPLNPKSCNILDVQKYNTIFNNIEVIKNVNYELLKRLDAHLAHDPEGSKIGQIFMTLAPWLRTYTQFVNSYEDIMTCVRETVKQNPSFEAFCKAAKENPKSAGLSLSSLLIAPVQRLARYPLLLRELVEHTVETHPDYPQLKTAMSKMQEVAAYVNEKSRDANNKRKLVEIMNKISGMKMNLIEPHRAYVHDGELTKVTSTQTKEMIFYLFSDLLVMCSKKRGRFRKCFRLNQAPFTWVRDLPDTDKVKNVFQIISVNTVVVSAKTPESKQLWIQKLNEVLSAILQKKPSLADTPAEIKDEEMKKQLKAFCGFARYYDPSKPPPLPSREGLYNTRTSGSFSDIGVLAGQASPRSNPSSPRRDSSDKFRADAVAAAEAAAAAAGDVPSYLASFRDASPSKAIAVGRALYHFPNQTQSKEPEELDFHIGDVMFIFVKNVFSNTSWYIGRHTGLKMHQVDNNADSSKQSRRPTVQYQAPVVPNQLGVQSFSDTGRYDIGLIPSTHIEILPDSIASVIINHLEEEHQEELIEEQRAHDELLRSESVDGTTLTDATDHTEMSELTDDELPSAPSEGPESPEIHSSLIRSPALSPRMMSLEMENSGLLSTESPQAPSTPSRSPEPEDINRSSSSSSSISITSESGAPAAPEQQQQQQQEQELPKTTADRKQEGLVGQQQQPAQQKEEEKEVEKEQQQQQQQQEEEEAAEEKEVAVAAAHNKNCDNSNNEQRQRQRQQQEQQQQQQPQQQQPPPITVMARPATTSPPKTAAPKATTATTTTNGVDTSAIGAAARLRPTTRSKLDEVGEVSSAYLEFIEKQKKIAQRYADQRTVDLARKQPVHEETEAPWMIEVKKKKLEKLTNRERASSSSSSSPIRSSTAQTTSQFRDAPNNGTTTTTTPEGISSSSYGRYSVNLGAMKASAEGGTPHQPQQRGSPLQRQHRLSPLALGSKHHQQQQPEEALEHPKMRKSVVISFPTTIISKEIAHGDAAKDDMTTPTSSSMSSLSAAAAIYEIPTTTATATSSLNATTVNNNNCSSSPTVPASPKGRPMSLANKLKISFKIQFADKEKQQQQQQPQQQQGNGSTPSGTAEEGYADDEEEEDEDTEDEGTNTNNDNKQ